MLQRVLEAREKRAQQRQNWADKNRLSLSLSFNIPGFPKSDSLINEAFNAVKSDLIRYIYACRLNLNIRESETTTDHAGDFFIVPLSSQTEDPYEIKSLFESFESNHPLSRLIDVDIFSKDGTPVSSGKAKKCLICSNPAIVCMREKAHTAEELREEIKRRMVSFLDNRVKEEIKQKLTTFATKALLYEVSVTPKPGLVDRYSQGSHTDMDFFTFVSSSSALAYFWKEIADAAFSWDGKERQSILIQLRIAGMKMERAMLEATGGVNTQKGAIFLMGFALFASAYCLYNKRQASDKDIREIVSYLNEGTLKELESGEGNTHGHKVYQRYGKEIAGGIRLEAEEGLPGVFEIALPVLRSDISADNQSEKAWNSALKRVLLHLMAKNNDTNILFRSDAETLAETKQLAHICLQGDELEQLAAYNRLIEYCEQKNISPGGSADLLAVSCFVYWVQNNLKLKT